MAKRKTPKVKNLVEKPTNITEDELTSLQNLVNAMNRTQMEIGSLESRKHSVLHNSLQLQNQLNQLQQTFQKTYGDADINITDGTITYPQDEQANKKD